MPTADGYTTLAELAALPAPAGDDPRDHWVPPTPPIPPYESAVADELRRVRIMEAERELAAAQAAVPVLEREYQARRSEAVRAQQYADAVEIRRTRAWNEYVRLRQRLAEDGRRLHYANTPAGDDPRTFEGVTQRIRELVGDGPGPGSADTRA
jgi:hypothetical protein